MIEIENVEVMGWDAAIRGMRNPMNSWKLSDSHPCLAKVLESDCEMVMSEHEPARECNDGEFGFCIGEKDFALMSRLRNAGTDHRKFMRMITVYLDITAPLYWWKEFSTYKVGTVANSCSTMHKLTAKKFSMEDFSFEDCDKWTKDVVCSCIINALNMNRNKYLETKDKEIWRQMIQLLPSSYNQRRTVMLNYEVLANIYKSRRNHKLDEWREFCTWIETLPYSELITGKNETKDMEETKE